MTRRAETAVAVNEVHLVGRLSGRPQVLELPSGDVVVVFRVVVARSGPGVDSVDCSVWAAGLQRRLLAMPADCVVDVQGCLRRRFWRSASGPASRTEVRVSALRRHR